MDRLAELISKLKQQFDDKADASQMLRTTQLIEQELVSRETSARNKISSTKVSVVMPATRRLVPALVEEDEPADVVLHKESTVPDPEPSIPDSEWSFDPLKEIPTLSHQQTVREINETIGVREASLNDKLKDEKVEIGHILTDAPIRDLKKAIGINDRYVFINELFRGDEVMYERSLKTINAFRIFPEAEYWIERELKVKLGWEEHKDTTRHFYQLVKRRFS
jgi:LPS O-antigen subunit length determinant protein (WzzB/FepE family)